ncbi:hypothetical protein ACLB2K_039675 [Fragaria x ananassa]
MTIRGTGTTGMASPGLAWVRKKIRTFKQVKFSSFTYSSLLVFDENGGDVVVIALLHQMYLQNVVYGYAVSEGGRGIERVDLSFDGGKTWEESMKYQKSTEVIYVADDTSAPQACMGVVQG